MTKNSWFDRMWPIRTRARTSSSVTLKPLMKTKKYYREVVAERTPDGAETLKITTKSDNVGGQTQTGDRAKLPILRIVDGPHPRRTVRAAHADGLMSSKTSATTYLQVATIQNRYVQENFSKSTWSANQRWSNYWSTIV